jgi:hypothetical protein
MSEKKPAKSQQKHSGDDKRASAKARDDELNSTLEDSFPASDPPQMTQPNVKAGGPERAKGAHK